MPRKISMSTLLGLFQERDTYSFGLLLAGSIIGLLASFILSVEAIELAKNSAATLSCDLNAVISCGTVGRHSSAALLGFPNSFVGMMTIPVVTTIAVAGLAGVVFPRWFMRAAYWGAVAGILFAAWMLYMSYVVIGALCPWCLTMDVGMILMFFALFRYNARERNVCSIRSVNEWAHRVVARDYDKVAMFGLMFLIAAAIIVKYGASM